MRLVILLLLVSVGYCAAQPVTITFTVGSQLDTEMDSLTSEYVLTTHGPYHFRNIKKMDFAALPDSASIQRLQSKDIGVYLQMKRVKPVVLKPVVKAPVKQTPDSVKAVTSQPTPAAEKAAEPPPLSTYEATISVGLGIGLDYGGMGMKFTFLETGPVSVFGGMGYNFAELGYNAGLEFNFNPHEKTTAFVSAMYGYNGVLLASGSRPSETFYGVTLGFGIKFRARTSENFFSVQIVAPIHNPDFQNNPNTDKTSPIGLSLGYHLAK